MQISTPLPIATLAFKHWWLDDTEVTVVVAKAVFTRRADGKFRAAEAAPIAMVETFAGDPANSPLIADQDVAPGKAATDLLIDAVARSPTGKPLADWRVSATIPDRLNYGFQVRGPCMWERGFLKWRCSAPTPVTEIPLSYSLAYGGPNPDTDPDDIYPYNPAGCGHPSQRILSDEEPFAAPQIGELAEFIAADVHAEMVVHGFGPIAKGWLPRRTDAGTFDDDWRMTRHPRMPLDYSLRFWNAAPKPMQINPPLRGGETISVDGIGLNGERVECCLPAVALFFDGAGSQKVEMALDTVALDLCAEDPMQHCMTLTWRCKVDADVPSGTITSQKVE